jgi:oligopeptide/dipeptide ABC transporter ATP-binding protein
MNDPRLLIADEPTTGLDVTVQAQILDLLRDLVSRFRMAVIVITHDLGVVAHYCDRVAVMYAGSIVESGPVGAVFERPAHPYSRSLIAATPERLNLGGARSLGGPPPNLYALPKGCHHRDRCAFAQDACLASPPDRGVGPSHFARCHFAGELPAWGEAAE